MSIAFSTFFAEYIYKFTTIFYQNNLDFAREKNIFETTKI